MATSLTANHVYRDKSVPGVYSSPDHDPKKSEIRELLTWYESAIQAGMLSDAVWKETKAALTADLAHDADTLGVVYADSTSANNGLYKKNGGSGSGSWTQITTFLPGYQFVKATNTDSGDPNAITASTSPRLPSGDGVALVRLNIVEANTSETVTVSFDGGTALQIKTASGGNPPVGGLVADMIVLGTVEGSTFRLASDIASAALLTQMEDVLEDFEGQYLGSHPDDASATADAGGSPQEGALYWNTTSKQMLVYSGSSWKPFASSTVADGSITTAKMANGAVTRAKLSTTLLNAIRMTPADFGAAGDGVSDDSDAIESAIQADVPLYWGGPEKVYRITRQISHTATKNVNWVSDGATIVMDSAASVQRIIDIELNSHEISTEGTLSIDANEKSFTGLYISNEGLLKVDVRLYGIRAKNCFRASTAFTGGDGISVYGHLRRVQISDFHVENVHMASGAGVSGSQGVSGVTVTRNNTDSEDADLIIISDFTIDGVYSDDAAYTMDQDGIKVFNSYNNGEFQSRPCTAIVTNGRIKNAHGRAIKAQTENPIISNILIVRDQTHVPVGEFYGNPDIDLQVGGGMVENIQCWYRGNFPSRIVNASVQRVPGAERSVPTTISVRDVTVSEFTPGNGIDRFMAVSADFEPFTPSTVMLNISGVSIFGNRGKSYFCTVTSSEVGTKFFANLVGIMARGGSGFVYRLGSVAAPCYVTGMSIRGAGSSAPLVAAASAGDVNGSLLGQNLFVT